MTEEFKSRICLYSAEEVIRLSEIQQAIELNNVIEGFEGDFFGISLVEENNLKEYLLTYIGNYDKLEGVTLRTGRFLKDRDTMTLWFSKTVEHIFPEINQLIVFNTFQAKIKEMYELFSILCVSQDIAKLKNTSILLPRNKRSIDYIHFVDILEIYRRLFRRKRLVFNIDEEPKVYLMYDKKEDKIKIGKTRKKLQVRRKGVAEATKRAKDPMIELLTAWKAPKVLEDQLHKVFDNKRVRGEWFNLRILDLETIDTLTQQYKMIDIKS